MESLKLFWSLNKFVGPLFTVVVMTACASVPSNPPSMSADSAFGNEDGSVAGVAFLTLSETEQKKVFGPDAPERINANLYASLCQNGKQIRGITAKVRAVVPKAKAGLPLDHANNLKSRAVDLIIDTAGKFFLYSSYTQQGASGYQKYYFVPSADPTLLISRFKSSEIRSDQNSPFEESEERTKIEEIRANERAEFSFAKIQGLPDIYLLDVQQIMELKKNVDRKWRDDGYFYSLDQPWSFPVRRRNPVGDLRVNQVDYADNYPNFFVVQDKPIVVPLNTKDTPNPELYPLRAAVIGELSVLRYEYTMLIPTEVQKKILAEKTSCNMEYSRANNLSDMNIALSVSAGTPLAAKVKCRKFHDFLGVDENNDLKPSLAIEQRDQIWDTYLSRFTSVKASHTSDPQVMDFELSLDLGPFCTYGRPLSDLVSK